MRLFIGVAIDVSAELNVTAEEQSCMIAISALPTRIQQSCIGQSISWTWYDPCFSIFFTKTTQYMINIRHLEHIEISLSSSIIHDK